MTRKEICNKANAASAAVRLAKTHCKRGHEYTPESTKDTGHGRQCMICVRFVAAEWKKKNAVRIKLSNRNGTLLKKYGLSSGLVDQMVIEQGGGCAICNTSKPGRRGWHVDHCHKTGKVRRVLCSRCNTGIGLLKDDPNLLRIAADYIERHSQ